MKPNRVKKYRMIVLAVILNMIAVYLVVSSVISSISQFREASVTQNVENIRTITDSSADKVSLVVAHYTEDVVTAADYVNHYQETGMTQEEMLAFFREYYRDKDVDWQLIANTPSKIEEPSKEYFGGYLLNDEENHEISYKVNHYPSMAAIFRKASGENLAEVNYINEYTDVSTLRKSFAIGCYVRVRNESAGDGASDYSYGTLLLVIQSEDVNGVITSNNSTDNFDFYNYSNVIVDQKGNYVFSNDKFQGKSFIRYIETYDSSFTVEAKKALLENLQNQQVDEPIYYKNSKEQDCIYTISSIQNTDWYILSVVPVESFHNVDHYSGNYVRFFLSFMFLFLIDIIFILLINRKLLKRTKEAQAASMAKSQFLSAMSHDIRTPMNAIVGMTMIAGESLKEEQPDKATLVDCIKTIDLSGHHLLTLINDILDISKIESGKVVITADDFSITETFEKMLEIIQPQVKEKKFVLETDMSHVIHTQVHADELRINQIFINILSNALKYTNAGGKIQVELREEEVPGRSDVTRFIYRVQDNGIGMTEEFQKTIFDRFTRAVDSRINIVQGSGLGLAIVKQLVDMMNGTISVESKLNEGSVFTVTLELPTALQPQAYSGHKEGEEEYEDKNIFQLQVLVAEDNLVNWKVISKLLSNYGIQAEYAQDGRQAVNMVVERKIPYDLIFMDIQMPVMNGYEAAEAIRKLVNPVKAATPIYAMTADTFAEDVARCQEKGMNGHLSKPIEIDRLLKVLRQIDGNKS